MPTAKARKIVGLSKSTKNLLFANNKPKGDEIEKIIIAITKVSLDRFFESNIVDKTIATGILWITIPESKE